MQEVAVMLQQPHRCICCKKQRGFLNMANSLEPISSIFTVGRFKLTLNVTDVLDVLLDRNSVLEMFLSIAPDQSVFFPLYYS